MRTGGVSWVAAAALLIGCGLARAQDPSSAGPQTTPASPAAAQPTLPTALPTPGAGTEPLTVRRKAAARRASHRQAAHRVAADRDAYGRDAYDDLDRPALAGVELVTAIPHPIQPPHHTVPVPAYPLENVINFYTAPPPPVICRRVPRDPYAPDPNLIREKAVVCEADNP